MGDVILGASDFLASIFLLTAFLFLNELRCSKKVTFLILITFVSGSFLLFVKFVLPGTAAGISSAAALTIPSMILFFFLSKYRDSRFVFIFCSVEIMGLIVIILSRITATLFDDNLVVIVLLTFTGLSLLLFFAWKIRNRYIELQRTLHGGWTRFAVVSALFYLMIYVIISYPSPLNQRREYIPAVILFCVIVITVYGVIIQTLMKSVTIYNEQRENELLETKLALQNSQLELKEIYYIMAYTDAMTGLKNRAAFEERKKKLSENPVGLSCLMLDLNNLKTTNDIYGHDKGDDVLVRFSDVLKNSVDDADSIYRIGGDEFAIIFTAYDSAQMEKVIANLKQEIRQTNRRSEIKISAAMGFASMSQDQIKDVEALIAAADKKMYENKREMKRSPDYVAAAMSIQRS